MTGLNLMVVPDDFDFDLIDPTLADSILTHPDNIRTIPKTYPVDDVPVEDTMIMLRNGCEVTAGYESEGEYYLTKL